MYAGWTLDYLYSVFRLEHAFNLNERVNCVCQNCRFLGTIAGLEAALIAVYDFAVYDLRV